MRHSIDEFINSQKAHSRKSAERLQNVLFFHKYRLKNRSIKRRKAIWLSNPKYRTIPSPRKERFTRGSTPKVYRVNLRTKCILGIFNWRNKVMNSFLATRIFSNTRKQTQWNRAGPLLLERKAEANYLLVKGKSRGTVNYWFGKFVNKLVRAVKD